ncbi:MAG TPA: hypothetical protein VL832_03225 [Puia sp.]|nr:hypothetical protein [Puia sp.]
MVKKDPFIEKCRQLIEASLHWGDASTWTNEDFDNLSERIFDKTAVRLSVSTLKRIWGKVRYDSSPTSATLNALARFAGYAGWREFQQQHPESPAGTDGRTSPSTSDPQASPPVLSDTAFATGRPSFAHPLSSGQQASSGQSAVPPSRSRWLMTSIIISTVVILIALISLFAARLRSGAIVQPPEESARVTFGSKITSDDLPNSVVFYYDASSLDPHRVILQQSWDTARRELIPANGKEITSIYYYPGYFMAKLIVDGTIRKESPVFIKTKGWKGIIEGTPLPIYLASAETGKEADPGLGISSEVLQKKTGSPIFNNTWIDFTNVREFDGIPAGHFTLSTTLRNTSTVEQCLCRKIKVTLLGTESAIIIPLADKGCISDLSMLTGDRMINGKDNDLSAFGCDFRNFQHLVCTVEDHRLKIMLNNTLIFNTEQRQDLGAIVGIRIAFEGAGQIKDLMLQGPGQALTLIPAQSR